MNVVFTSDLHGRAGLYEETMSLAVRSHARAIILGGDLFPTLIPNPLRLISGGADFQDDLKGQFRFVEDYLVPSLHSFLSAHPGIGLLYTPGNHDWIPVVRRFENLLPEALNVHRRIVVHGGMQVFGYACVTDSTFWVKDFSRRDMTGDTYVPSRFAMVSDTDRLVASPHGAYALGEMSMEEELAGVRFEDPGRAVCVFHCPPYDTGLDTLHNGRPIGSRAVRAFLEDRQPALSLHGHIHEAPYMSGDFRAFVGNTLSVNAGYGPDALHAVVFDDNDPSGTMTHSLFGKRVQASGLRSRMPERRMRKIKAFFMDTVLRGRRHDS